VSPPAATLLHSRASAKPSARAVAQPLILFMAWCLIIPFTSRGANLSNDVAKLPPPATNHIEFLRDIQPIFERTCLRCHGPERPKSKFRLDNRQAALAGGENEPGRDIVPGDSANSQLIHYVAGFDPELRMPPPGKGDPLTAQEIGLLRAWIDQGADWSGGATAGPEATASLTGGGFLVNGNRSVFRELLWKPSGADGGFEQFMLSEKLDPWSRFFMEGHALRDDVALNMKLERVNFGFVNVGLEQYRKYYSDSGGYYPLFSPSVYSLGRDLHLDTGKAFIDFGLTLPNWPKLTVGYEFQHKEGEKSTLEWGPVDQGLLEGKRNIFPASKEIREHVHIIKLDLEHEIWGVRIEDSFRAEFYDLNTRRANVGNLSTVDPSLNFTNRFRDGFKQFVGANVIRVEKQFTDWLFASVGYLYSHLEANTDYNLDTLAAPGFSPVTHAFSDQVIFERESHVGSVSTLLGPWDGLSLFGGIQNEWSRQKGFGNYFEDAGFGLLDFTTLSSDLDKVLLEEHAGLRYTKIPFTVLFADTRFRQESLGQFEERTTVGLDQHRDLVRDTDARARGEDVRVGFTTSPWNRVSFGAHYRWADNETHYDHVRDESQLGGLGYSAFIRSRDIRSDEIELKVVLRPASWIKTTLKYKLSAMDYVTGTDPLDLFGLPDIARAGTVLAGNYDAHTYSANAVISPLPRLYLSSTFSYINARTVTDNHDIPAVAPYSGEIYSLLASATYAWTEKTHLQAAYIFSYSDFGQHNFEEGLPVGMTYHEHGITASISRKFLKNFSARLNYGFFLYNEPSSGHFNDFAAHSIFATLTMRWP
jgi:hypothetical protein